MLCYDIFQKEKVALCFGCGILAHVERERRRLNFGANQRIVRDAWEET